MAVVAPFTVIAFVRKRERKIHNVTASRHIYAEKIFLFEFRAWRESSMCNLIILVDSWLQKM